MPPANLALRLIGPALLGILLALFWVTRSFALIPHSADEGIYFYGAKRMAEGLVPYRDFFHAHPPFHLLPTAILLWLADYSLALVKAPVFFWAAFQGAAAYLIVLRLQPNASRLAREASGLIAAALLLFCESMLKGAAYDTGIVQASGIVALGAVLLVTGRFLGAGIVVACAPLTLLQSGPAAALVVIAALAMDRRKGLKTMASAAATFALVHLIYWGIAGSAFWQQTYLFHIEKVENRGEGAIQLGYSLYDNWALFVSAAVGTLALMLGERKQRIIGILCLGATALTFIAMATRPRVFPFYFLPAFFSAALATGLGLGRIVNRIHAALRERNASRVDFTVWAPALIWVGLLTLLADPVSSAISPARAAQVASYEQTYTWVDGPGIGGGLNGVMRSLFWRDGKRDRGVDANPITQYLWQRSRWLNVVPDMVEAVRAERQLRVETTLFGDSTIVPLVAMEAGVSITGDLVDTNTQRIGAGNLTMAEVLALLDTQPSALVLVGSSGIGSNPELRTYLQQKYGVLRHFTPTTGRNFTLFRRKT
ncbi:MAG: hypothetical protein SGI86_06700 [Deltaproteobacteria bacterium]|nr:hypothetical protein [Deltaproteobacteria bacterium]